MPIKKYKKLSPAQTYLLYNYVNHNKNKLKNLTDIDATKECRRELCFHITRSAYVKAKQYFNLKKDLCVESNTVKIQILAKHIAILYKESLLVVPEELRKLLGE